MENKSIEEIANSQKNFLSTGEVAAVLGISPVTFRRRAEEYAKFFSHREGRKEIQNTQRAVHRICEDGQST